MNRLSFIYAGTILFILIASAVAQSPDDSPKRDEVRIPLDQIWAYDMPGTRDITTLANRGNSDVEASVHALSTPPNKGSDARSAFAVQGTGTSAISAARAILVENKPAKMHFTADSDVTLVFFSYEFNRYVHLKDIVQQDNTIRIEYQLVPHKSKELTVHFALIPLGKQSPGEKQVQIVQLPMDQRWSDAGVKPVDTDTEHKIVSKSFSFSVVNERKK